MGHVAVTGVQYPISFRWREIWAKEVSGARYSEKQRAESHMSVKRARDGQHVNATSCDISKGREIHPDYRALRTTLTCKGPASVKSRRTYGPSARSWGTWNSGRSGDAVFCSMIVRPVISVSTPR